MRTLILMALIPTVWWLIWAMTNHFDPAIRRRWRRRRF